MEPRSDGITKRATMLHAAGSNWEVLMVVLIIYFIPTLTAYLRNHRKLRAILVVNLLLGWTLLGWIAAFVWSFTKDAIA
jgi:Superinfection immunity protein